jgi:hypothetical protein
LLSECVGAANARAATSIDIRTYLTLKENLTFLPIYGINRIAAILSSTLTLFILGTKGDLQCLQNI